MRVLFLSHRLPYAPNRGDRVRAYHELRQLATWAEVDLVSLVHDEEEAAHASDLRSCARTINTVRVGRASNLVRSLLALPTSQATTHTMFHAPDLLPTVERIVRDRPPDVVFAFCTGVAPVVFEPPLRHVPLVLDIVDVDSCKWQALAEAAPPPKSWIYRREARVLAGFERKIADHAFTTLITTGKERDLLHGIAPAARIDVIQNGVEAASLRPPGDPVEAPVVVFCGVMNYVPNEEAAAWLGSQVWPLVRRERPDARLSLVGSSPTRAVQRLADDADGIRVTGHVADVRDYLWSSAVSVAPLLTARGIQNKVLEAVAAGLPTVVTPAVFAGLPPEVHSACVTADGAPAFAAAIVALLNQSPAQRRALALGADLTALSWARRLASLPDILEAAAASHS